MYQYLLRYRRALKKDRVRPEDLSDEPSSLQINRQETTLFTLTQTEEPGLREAAEEKKKQRRLEKEQLEAFYKWQRQMWIDLKKHVKQREVEGRPNYYHKWDEAVQKHLDGFRVEFRVRAVHEQQSIESVWKDPKGIVDFREHLLYILQAENIEKEDFFEHLLIVKDS